MEFKQIAMVADSRFILQEVMTECGWIWTKDTVTAKGILKPEIGLVEIIENTAELRFNYDMFPGKEFELIHYIRGSNFLGCRLPGTMSHFGVHVPVLNDFRDYLAQKGFTIVQEVITTEHTNPVVLQTGNHYHYAIFRHPALKVFWKLIQRLDSINKCLNAQSEMNARYCRDIF